MRLAAAVAGFADALRGGTRTDGWGWQAIAETARASRNHDRGGERAELLDLIETAQRLLDAQPDHPAIGDATLSK